jgi:predicted permease
LKEPVVWAPILAILLVALDVTLPKLLVTSLQLLGSTTSGVSFFASGIILRALTPTVSIPIVASTVSRLAVVPALAFFVFPLAGVNGKALSDSVVALAMPCAVMLIILSVRYKIAERESASVLFYSYLFSAVSMTFAVLLTT